MTNKHPTEASERATTPPDPSRPSSGDQSGDRSVPTRVMMYTLAADPGQVTPIAEFTYDPERDVVTYTELDARWSRPAQRLYTHGISAPGHEHTITVNHGPEFMRALLAPARTSMYGFLDKSDEPA
jgi:hypothetical protein